jgi:glycerol-3-phosphate dehydrogenase (NAD(P)+)
MKTLQNAVIWGAGSWGTALALHLSKVCEGVGLWVFEEDQFQSMSKSRANEDFLPGCPLPANIRLFHEPEDFSPDAALWVSVVPTQFLPPLWNRIGPKCPGDTLVVSASKGIEQASLKLPCEILDAVLPAGAAPAVALSGPSFAAGLAAGDPTAVVFGCPDTKRAQRAQRLFSHDHLRGYVTRDRKGVELGGAVKNVIALACGIASGLGFGHNAVAAIITRGLSEIVRLGTALGADAQTFSGLSGIGDLVLTCTGGESRNRTVGTRLGRGEKLEDILHAMKMVAEGVATTCSVCELASREDVEMPITSAVERILYRGLSPEQALKELLARELKPEAW